MTVRAFIPKDHMELPDAYGMTVFFLDGKTETYEVASHRSLLYGLSPSKEFVRVDMIELCLSDDRYILIPHTSISRIEFDKRYSKVLEIQKELKEATH